MSYTNMAVSRSFTSGGTIRPSRFVTEDTVNGAGYCLEANANEPVWGVSPAAPFDQDTANAADSGDNIQCFTGGIVRVTAGDAVAVGDYVKSDADGRAVPITSPATAAAIQYVGGVAMTPASAASELVMVVLTPHASVQGDPTNS